MVDMNMNMIICLFKLDCIDSSISPPPCTIFYCRPDIYTPIMIQRLDFFRIYKLIIIISKSQQIIFKFNC